MKKRIQIPCPDGVPGCAVFHFRTVDDGAADHNQCDGCKRGLPIRDGIHHGEGYDMIACSAHRYDKGPSK